MRRSNSARCCGSSAARRLCQASRLLRPRSPAARHGARIAGGISKAGALQPSSLRVAAISSGAERRAVALLGAAFGRRAEADGGAAGDQRRPVGFFGRFNGGGDRRGIVAVDAGRRPASGREALHLIDRVGERQRAVDRDAVVVEQHDQLVQLQMPGERDRFLADALHQVAVGREHVCRMIDEIAAEQRGEVALGDGHADGVGQPLAERSGRGLDAGRVTVFGMAGRERAELAEALDLGDRHRLVAGEIEQRVDQHRAMAGRQHEAVAVGPGRIGRVEFEVAREQHGRDVGRAHRQAGMAGLRLLDGVHRQRADGVRHAVVVRARGRSCFGKTCSLGEVCARRGKTVRHRHETAKRGTNLSGRGHGNRRRTDSMQELEVKCAAGPRPASCTGRRGYCFRR